jgi:hypothetical protein
VIVEICKAMEEFNNLFNLHEIDEVLHDRYRDKVVKEVGDRVGVIDFSSVTRLDGSHIDQFDEDMQFSVLTYFIIIETRQRHRYDAGFTFYNQDVVMVNPRNKMQYRAYSGHLTVVKK